MRGLSLDDFEGREGQPFDVRVGDRTIALTLARVRALPDTGRDGGSFVLDWLGPYEPVLPQGIYAFDDAGEEFEIFIVPVAQDRSGARYEAVFN